ncbi:MAG: CarD family transcriptional regulator [Myxococcota bacterium]|nr:CarD family transcriptional regulator [Myxococcota bacterium]
MDFKRGDSAVYPGCGVGVVEEIQKIDLGEGSTEMYVIQFPEDGTKVWVPTVQAQAQGLRKVMSPKTVEETYTAIRRQEIPERLATWNRRFRTYSEKIQTNDPKEMGEVLGELAAIKSTKDLSFGERRIFRKVHGLLVRELAIALDTKEDTISEKLDEIINKV